MNATMGDRSATRPRHVLHGRVGGIHRDPLTVTLPKALPLETAPPRHTALRTIVAPLFALNRLKGAEHHARERTLALIISGTGYLKVRTPMANWEKRYKAEGLDLRYLQCLDHFAPALHADPRVQYYSRMVCEMNNIGTLESIIAMNQALQVPDSDKFYAALQRPTLIISGTADRNHASAVELQKHMKGSILKAIEGAGHAVMQEAPWEYDRYSIEFLDSLGLWPMNAANYQLRPDFQD